MVSQAAPGHLFACNSYPTPFAQERAFVGACERPVREKGFDRPNVTVNRPKGAPTRLNTPTWTILQAANFEDAKGRRVCAPA